MEDEIFSSSSLWREQIVFFIKTHSRQFWVIFFILFFFLSFYVILFKAPRHFPVKVIVSIHEGTNLSQAAELLEKEFIVKSGTFFKWLVLLGAGDRSIISGDYFFSSPLSVFAVVSRLTTGDYGLLPIRITIPEGTSVREMSVLFEKYFPAFSREDFEALAGKDEGYLFPDTYLFLPNVKAEQVYREVRATFDRRIKEISEDITESGKKLRDIIIMASLVEEEGRTEETREVIAGILWERLRIGMALQVDAPFVYLIGKGTSQLTLDDLELDSPYNTYKYPGLPQGPITNPGLASIRAVLNPTPTPYLYFLTDKEGVMHYAETHDGHVRNKELYLP